MGRLKTEMSDASEMDGGYVIDSHNYAILYAIFNVQWKSASSVIAFRLDGSTLR